MFQVNFTQETGGSDKIKRRIIKGIRLLAVLSMLLAFTGTGFADDISKLREKAAEEGQVAVIVGLQLPAPGFKPEGTLASPEAVKQQREAIMVSRLRFLENMSRFVPGEYEQYAEYDTVPQVAIKVSAKALDYLINNPLVTLIEEDKEREPHKNGAGVEHSEDTSGNIKSGAD